MRQIVSAIFICVVFFFGCKSQERLNSVEPVEKCAGINQLLLSPVNVISAFANNQLQDLLDFSVQLTWIDSSNADGTPFAAMLDFGRSSLGKDGHKRGGVWILQWQQNSKGEPDSVWMSLSANYSDTGYQNSRLNLNNEEVYLNGNFTLVKRNNQQFHVWVNAKLENAHDQFSINQDWDMRWENNLLNPISIWDLGSYSIAGTIESIEKSSGSTEKIGVTSADIIKISGCLKGFTKGKLFFQQNADSNKSELDFDPFNDTRCDEFALIIQGKTERLISLW